MMRIEISIIYRIICIRIFKGSYSILYIPIFANLKYLNILVKVQCVKEYLLVVNVNE